MNYKDFKRDYIDNYNELCYIDDKYYISMVYVNGGKVCCTTSPDSAGVLFADVNEALEKFVINGKIFKDVLPELDINKMR